MDETAYDRIVRALLEHGSRVTDSHGGYRCEAQCPVHEDRNASLSVTGIYERALVWCHAGCLTPDVMAALQLTMADLYDNRSATYRYDDGRTVRRYYEQGKKQFGQVGAGPTSALYHRDKLAGIEPGRTVFLVEGESDVGAIEAAGGVATTAPQGADSFHKVDVGPLKGLWVTAVVDRDDAGDKWAQQVAAKLEGVADRYRFARAAEGKDASDHIAAGHSLNDFEPYAPPGLGDRPQDWPPRYGDLAALLDGSLPPAPRPDVLRRVDRQALIYRGKTNVLFGDAESGKTWIALAAVVEVLAAGGKAAYMDLDHNGAQEIAHRLIILGADPAVLRDLGRFRYCAPDDAQELRYFVGDLAGWGPDVAVVDSLGEVLPMLGLSSNSPDDYTRAHREVPTPLAAAGAAVIVIDHLPKDDTAREKGQTGTLAKRRAVNGVTLRVTAKDAFTPGRGGSASLAVYKDRPGGLRGACPPGRNPPAGRFVMEDDGTGSLEWWVTVPPAGAGAAKSGAPDADVAELDSLAPAPCSQRDVEERLRWGSNRALLALRTWRDLQECRSEEGLG